MTTLTLDQELSAIDREINAILEARKRVHEAEYDRMLRRLYGRRNGLRLRLAAAEEEARRG